MVWLVAAAVLSIAMWQAAERLAQGFTHPLHAEMLAAARTMEAASRVLWAEKQARGLLPPPEADPNQTGMIGPEFTSITTSIGSPPSKRTTAAPDFSAALVRLVGTLDLPAGTPVVIVVSGSFVGGNTAAIAAVEALGLRPIVVASMSASMWGATDPEFTWLDMMALLRARNVIQADTAAAVLGGTGGTGREMDQGGIAALRAAAARNRVPLVEARPLADLIDALLERLSTALGEAGRPGLVINVGGSVIGLGSCRESFEFPPGLTTRPVTCTNGTPGLAIRFAQTGVPVLHVLNIRRLSLELGLPFDPVPLPALGRNTAIYGL